MKVNNDSFLIAFISKILL